MRRSKNIACRRRSKQGRGSAYRKCASFFNSSSCIEKKTLCASEGDCERVEQERQAWREKTASIDPKRLIFVDETGMNLAMTRRYARAEGQARAYGSAPKNPGKNISLIASLSVDGKMTGMSFPGALDGEAYHVYVEKILCPTLQPDDIVVVDNLRVHEDERVRALIQSCGAQLWFLPPYSPRLNPIEECFSKVKTILRSAAARTQEALENAITYALDTITPSDARGWFEDSGYRLSSA